LKEQSNTRRLIVIGVIFLAGILLGLAGFGAAGYIREINPNFMLPHTQPAISLNQEFSRRIESHIDAQGFLDFSQVADFEWDEMLIVTPYQDPWQILEDNGFRRQRLNSGIKYEDWQNLLIFLNEGSVAGYINLSRSIADFQGHAQSNQVLRRENTTFYVIQPESVWQAWHGPHLSHWDESAGFPLRSRLWEAFAHTVRGEVEGGGEGESHFVYVEPLTDPDDIARHELSRDLFPFAPSSSILSVPEYDEESLPPFISVEIITLSLHQAEYPPQLPQDSIGNHNYSNGEQLGLYTGTIHYVRSDDEYIGDGWWAVASWWQGTLYLM